MGTGNSVERSSSLHGLHGPYMQASCGSHCTSNDVSGAKGYVQLTDGIIGIIRIKLTWHDRAAYRRSRFPEETERVLVLSCNLPWRAAGLGLVRGLAAHLGEFKFSKEMSRKKESANFLALRLCPEERDPLHYYMAAIPYTRAIETAPFPGLPCVWVGQNRHERINQLGKAGSPKLG